MSKKKSRMTEAILETAGDMAALGIMTQKDYEKITMRHLKKQKQPAIDPMSGGEIRSLRENSHLSQAAFASYLNLSVGYISQLERGLKEPTGAVLALLNVIRRRGVDVILH